MRVRRKSPQPSREQLTADSTVSRAIAMRLIADEILKPGEDLRQVRNRVSHAIREAIEKEQIAPPGPKGFRFGRLVWWARRRWKGHFRGWPTEVIVTPHTGKVELISPPGFSWSPPEDTLEHWRAFGHRMADNYQKVWHENRALRSENAELRPYKEADESRRRKASEKGKLGRGVSRRRT